MTTLYCLHCHEPVLFTDSVPVNGGLHQMHRECMLRQIVGSIGHQKGTCGCYGECETDPVDMSVREAARAAVAYWQGHHLTR